MVELERIRSGVSLEILDRPNPIRLNLGAGKKVVPGFKSFGYEESHDFKGDLRDLSQFADNSIDELMSIHTIEHVNRWQVPDMLSGWLRVLKPGGRLAVECPDLIKCCKNILKGLPRQEGIQGIFGEWELKDELMLHRHGWTPDEMRQVLHDAGFAKIKFVQPIYHGRRDHRDMRAEAVKP